MLLITRLLNINIQQPFLLPLRMQIKERNPHRRHRRNRALELLLRVSPRVPHASVAIPAARVQRGRLELVLNVRFDVVLDADVHRRPWWPGGAVLGGGDVLHEETD